MIDADSPILDFYPETFRIDMNGKKLAWQGVALLPFIDPDRLLAAMAARYPELTDEERRRNRWGNNLMLLADGSPLYDVFCELYTKKRSHAVSEFPRVNPVHVYVLSKCLHIARPTGSIAQQGSVWICHGRSSLCPWLHVYFALRGSRLTRYS